MNQQITDMKSRDLINQRNVNVNTQLSQFNTKSYQDIFDYGEFNDSLAYVMRRYCALHIQKKHNDEVTALLDGESNKALSRRADAQIKKTMKMLMKLQKILKNFSF